VVDGGLRTEQPGVGEIAARKIGRGVGLNPGNVVVCHAIVDQVGIVDQGVKRVKAGISPQRTQRTQRKRSGAGGRPGDFGNIRMKAIRYRKRRAGARP